MKTNISRLGLARLTTQCTLMVALAFSSAPQASEDAAIKTLKGKQPDAVENMQLYRDLDEDRVKDAQDQCPNSDVRYSVDTFGCELDSDGDGIYDRNDQCPNTPHNRQVNFLGCEADSDKDLVLDSQDKCPNTPLNAKVNQFGCEIDNDGDKDGVPDAMDQCPKTPLGATVNQYGCVPRVKVVINVTFPTNSAVIPPNQKVKLDQGASQLKALRADEVILISGHTDSQGSAQLNQKLSWARAKSIKSYAVENFNLSPAQIYLQGKGESDPIASNATKEGRQKNRRIEFNVVSVKQLPKDAQLETPPEFTWVKR